MPEAPLVGRQPLLAEMITVRNRFLRSVHIERDRSEADNREYHLTATGHQALDAVADALDQPAHRAITLTGPYGVGKSAFCLYLVGLLGVDGDPRTGEMLRGRDFRLYRRLVANRRGLVPVLLTGSREPVARALTEGLLRSMEQRGSLLLLEELRRDAGELLEHPDPSPREVAKLYELAARLVTEDGADGLLLVADEVGKFLEYAATHPDRGDPFVLQEMAEAAARSDAYPLVVVTVFHQAAEAYARRLGRVHQVEWAKVQQRFRDVSFSPTDLEQLSLVGHALSQKRSLLIPASFSSTAKECSKRGLVPKGGETRFVRTARNAFPLHPVALLALPGLFRRVGQNERSLFAFLSGEEPHALRRFLRETPHDQAKPALFTLDALFDYAREALLGNGAVGATTREWAELIDAVTPAEELPPLAIRVLKCIGLLGILREPRLTASKETLRLALADGTVSESAVDDALLLLCERRLIVHSRHRRAFRVWEGRWSRTARHAPTSNSGCGEGIARAPHRAAWWEKRQMAEMRRAAMIHGQGELRIDAAPRPGESAVEATGPSSGVIARIASRRSPR